MTAIDHRSAGLGVGIYDIPVEDYRADPCADVSLSRSGIVTLLNGTPAHFRARHPRLSPWPIKDEPTDAQKLGSVVHKMILGRGDDFTVIDLADFRNKDGSPAKTFGNAAAKAAKDAAEAQGLIVLDIDTHMQALAVAEYATKALAARFGGWPIGESEQTVVWQRDTDYGRIWCRARPDHFSYRAATAVDIKTTANPVSDEELSKKLPSDGDDIQAAWYLEGLTSIYPDLAGLLQFVFIVAEVEPPYEVRDDVQLSESWLTRARFRIDRAANIFARCLAEKSWPGYGRKKTVLNPPSWLETRWEAEELENV